MSVVAFPAGSRSFTGKSPSDPKSKNQRVLEALEGQKKVATDLLATLEADGKAGIIIGDKVFLADKTVLVAVKAQLNLQLAQTNREIGFNGG